MASVVALLVLVTASCGAGATSGTPGAQPPAPSELAMAAFPRTVVDASQHPLTLPAEPRRIVSLSAGATETLFALGAGDRLVAVDQYSDYPEAARGLAKVDYSSPSAEQLIALQPDLVLMSRRQRDLVQSFRRLGLSVLYLGEPASLDGVFEGIILIGSATGADAEASGLVLDLRQRLNAVIERVTDVTAGPRVYYELTPALHTVAPSSFIGSMLTTLDAENIASGITPFPQLTAEALLAADPEVVLLADVVALKVEPASIGQRPGWGQLSAVRNERIYVIDPDMASRPGPRVIDALEMMAETLYPERFPRPESNDRR